MKRVMTIAAAGVAALLLTLNMGVLAQQPDTHDRTIMTFSAPVELPGVTLQAGTYVFKLADIPSRNVVQVMTKDEKDIVGQWLFVPAERRDATDETVVSFKETKEGTTPAVQYWYYPGERIGKEFIYPKDQALKIAARTGATVKTEEGDVSASSATASADAGVINGSGVPASQPAPEATVASSEPAPAPQTDTVGTSGSSSSDQSATATDRGPRQESTQASSKSELPHTASPLPLSGLLGFFSLAGAGVLRRFRR